MTTPTLDELADRVLELSEAVGRMSPGGRRSTWRYDRWAPERKDETLGSLVYDEVERRLVRRVRYSMPGRAYVRTRVAYRRTRRVGRATVRSARRTAKAGMKLGMLAVQAPQILLSILVSALVVALIYYAWVGMRKVEWLTGKIVPSSAACGTGTAHQAGFLWWGNHDDGRGTSFTDFAGAMGRWGASKIHISAEDEAKAVSWTVRETTKVGVVLFRTLTSGVYDPPTKPEPTAEQSAFGTCCGTSSPTAYRPGDTPAMTAVRAAAAAGWTGDDLTEAVAVAGAESHWVATAQNPTSSAKGEWQIMMSYHAPKFQGQPWQDPYANARVAHIIWDDANGWSPWSTYPSAAATYLPQARAAVAAVAGTPTVQPASDVLQAGQTVPVACGASAGAPSPDGFDQLGNPHTVEQALAWDADMAARAETVTQRMCDHYVAEAYGWPNSGSVTARAHWEAIPASLKHVGADGVPPRGALVFWANSAPGHVAVSDGAGYVYTTDRIAGKITRETLAHIDGWGPRLGWSAPYFVGHSTLPPNA